MTRLHLLVLTAAVCLAPAAVQAQSRATTIFRGGAKSFSAGSPAIARSGGSSLSFRGFQGAVPFFGGGFGSAYGYGYDGNLLYRMGQIPVPPYFALHPPVYYSEPLPHPYGASPYARRPAPAPQYDVVPQPAVVINPHYKKPAEKKKTNSASQEKTVSKPKLIVNPFYNAHGSRQVELAQAD